MQSFSMQGQEKVHHVNFLRPHQRGVQHFSLPEYSENSGKCISITLSTHVETVVKLSLKKDTPKIEVIMKPDEESNYMDCQHFFRQIFLGYFSDIVQAFDTLRKNVCGDDYTSLHNPIVLSSVLPAYGMFHSIQILFL